MRNRSFHAEGFVHADEDNLIAEQDFRFALDNDEQVVVRVGVRRRRAAALRGEVSDRAVLDGTFCAEQRLRRKFT